LRARDFWWFSVAGSAVATTIPILIILVLIAIRHSLVWRRW
jgi:hypothetical protein